MYEEDLNDLNLELMLKWNIFFWLSKKISWQVIIYQLRSGVCSDQHSVYIYAPLWPDIKILVHFKLNLLVVFATDCLIWLIQSLYYAENFNHNPF